MPLIMAIAAFALIGLSEPMPATPGSMLTATLVGFVVPIVGGFALLALAAHAAHQLDSGNLAAVARIRRATAVYRVACLAGYAAAVLGQPWPGLVRSALGDVPALDELLIATPIWIALTVSFAALHPAERRLREAMLFRRLDDGRPVHPPLGLAGSVLSGWRHQVLLIAVPLTMMTAWTESVDMIAPRRGVPPIAAGMMQLAGVATTLAFAPLVLRYIWDTVPVRDGPLHDTVLSMCRRHRVRITELLVWRTGGTIINAAVSGLLPVVRYVVISDALLETLPRRGVEGVAAHELAHVRHRHLAWIAATVLAAVGIAGTAFSWLTVLLLGLGLDPRTATVLLAVLTLAAVLTAMGYVSRRFEWQADAFAVRHLSMTDELAPQPGRVSPAAASEMSAALSSVALLNGMDPRRFTWRHGSISERQRRIATLVDAPLNGIPIDRTVTVLKWIILAALVLAAAAVAIDEVLRAVF